MAGRRTHQHRYYIPDIVGSVRTVQLNRYLVETTTKLKAINRLPKSKSELIKDSIFLLFPKAIASSQL
jgi:hypothetical protein